MRLYDYQYQVIADFSDREGLTVECIEEALSPESWERVVSTMEKYDKSSLYLIIERGDLDILEIYFSTSKNSWVTWTWGYNASLEIDFPYKYKDLFGLIAEVTSLRTKLDSVKLNSSGDTMSS